MGTISFNSIVVLYVVTPCSLAGGYRLFRTIGVHLQDCMLSYYKRPQFANLPPWKPEELCEVVLYTFSHKIKSQIT